MNSEGLSKGQFTIGLAAGSGEYDVIAYAAGIHERHHRVARIGALGCRELGVRNDVAQRRFTRCVSPGG